MKTNFLRRGTACALAALLLALAGCGTAENTAALAQDLGEVTTVSREEGSGTRMDFEALAGTGEAGASRRVYSTEEMLAAVAADKNAVGYLAAEALKGTSAHGVRAVKLNEIEASTQMVLGRRYPLCRSYYLAYPTGLSPVEADFLKFTLTAGQTCVARYAVSARVPDTFLSDGSAGKVTLCGSSSATDMAEALAREYMRRNPAATVTMEQSDSAAGLAAVLAGECSFAVSSRPLSTAEASQLQTAEIAVDAIVVIVNEENPVVSLTTEQVKQLYNGEITEWNEILGD